MKDILFFYIVHWKCAKDIQFLCVVHWKRVMDILDLCYAHEFQNMLLFEVNFFGEICELFFYIFSLLIIFLFLCQKTLRWCIDIIDNNFCF